MRHGLQRKACGARRTLARRFPGGFFILCLVLLDGCSASPPPRPEPPAGIMRATAAEPVGPAGAGVQVPGTVEVVLDDVPPGRSIDAVALVDPDGGRHPASALVAARRESGAAAPNPIIGIGVTGGSSSGINPVVSLSLSLFGNDSEAGESRRRVIARVPLGAAAPQSFAGWRIAVSVTEVTGEARTLDLPLGAARSP